MKLFKILTYVFLFIVIFSFNLYAQTRQMIGTVVGIAYSPFSKIKFAVITQDGMKFIGEANLNCSWIVKDQQVRINVSTTGAIVDNGRNSCPFNFDKIVDNGQKQ